ncbi:MAG: hypothetical protein IH923_11370 [Nitrospinae bacterium]|nr:hypothetical protein [Nitrospinota bacterium]
MWKTKFWLFQIVMLVMLSLLFGSPVFAGPPAHSKGKGAEMSRMALTNHAGDHSKGMKNANENAAFYVEEEQDPPAPVPGDDPLECPDGTILLVDENGAEYCHQIFSF